MICVHLLLVVVADNGYSVVPKKWDANRHKWIKDYVNENGGVFVTPMDYSEDEQIIQKSEFFY